MTELAPAPIDTGLVLLVLQHPQEKTEKLATVPLLEANLANMRKAVGLSWPNLARALGRDADPRRWGVLYLGSAKPGDAPVTAVDARAAPLADQRAALDDLEGIIVLDGTWSQAKALWWRNPWLLKCRRLVLNPPFVSHYGRLRREPRRESLSTLESAGFALSSLEGRPEILERLLRAFETLLQGSGRTPQPDRRRNRRGGPGRKPK